MKMVKPEIELIRFGAEDVITASDAPLGSKQSFGSPVGDIVTDDTDKSLVKDYYSDPGSLWNNTTQ